MTWSFGSIEKLATLSLSHRHFKSICWQLLMCWWLAGTWTERFHDNPWISNCMGDLFQIGAHPQISQNTKKILTLHPLQNNSRSLASRTWSWAEITCASRFGSASSNPSRLVLRDCGDPLGALQENDPNLGDFTPYSFNKNFVVFSREERSIGKRTSQTLLGRCCLPTPRIKHLWKRC